MTAPLSDQIVRLAVALGAAEAGGPLSAEESELIERAVTSSPVPLKSEVVAAASSLRSGGDPLGAMFYDLRDAAERRGSGTVYTPDAIVRPMVEWTLAQQPARVVDAGCGSGRYTAAILKHDPHLAVVAIDLDPLATVMTRAAVAVLGAGDTTRVIQGDFTRARLPKVDGSTAFVGNPPYLRHHQIPAKTKAWAQLAAGSLGLKISGLAGLHALFFLATGLLGQKGDTGCYVTSSEWLDVNYGSIVRGLLTGPLGGEHIHILSPEVEAFEGTQTTATITTFRIGEPVAGIGFRSVSSVAEIRDLTAPPNPVAHARLVETSRWSTFVRTRTQVPADHVELGEIMRVHRGAVTGANAVWVTSDGAGLPESALRPAVTKAFELFAAGQELLDDSSLRRVIDLPTDLESAFESRELRRVKRFLTEARKLDVHKGYVARTRKAWWSVGLREPAPILATYMARRPPAFVINRVKARHINIAHGLYPRQELPEGALRALAHSLSTGVSLSQGRTYSGGLTKFEPREMERLPVPDLATLMSYAGNSPTLDD
ncbi:methyltransferase [Agromyces neolithicus]|uniref:methyltransferase n=1 Tax=Agromyces neolithicus TaxID=269420 RepID=UPI0031E4721C